MPRGGGSEVDGLGIGVSRWKLLHVQWESDEVLLYSTRNSIQSPVIYPDGKEYILKITQNLKAYLFISELKTRAAFSIPERWRRCTWPYSFQEVQGKPQDVV